MPTTKAATASRRAAERSSRPIARPTIAAAAAATPIGNMNVSDARLIAISWAASGTAPNQPSATAPPENTAISIQLWNATGTPMRSIRSIGATLNDSRRHGTMAPCNCRQPK